MGTTPPPSASTSVNSPVGYVSQVTPQPQMMSKSPFDVPPTVSARVESASAPIVAMDSKKKKSHGFFRALALFALFVTWVLMLLDCVGVMHASFGGYDLNLLFGVIVVCAVPILFFYRGFLGKLFWLLMFLVVVGWVSTIAIYHSLSISTTRTFNQKLMFASDVVWANALRINSYLWDYSLSAKSLGGDLLLSGSYFGDRKLAVKTWFVNQSAVLYLQEDANRNVLQKPRSALSLQVSDSGLSDVYMKSFWGISELDFRNSSWQELAHHGAVNKVKMFVWEDFASGANLQIVGAWQDVHLIVPKNVGVRLYYKQLVGNMALPDIVPSGQKNQYISSNLDTVEKIINIYVNVGIWKLKIERE